MMLDTEMALPDASSLAPTGRARFNGVLVDLDGTLMTGGRALPGAVELVEALGERLAVVSNDAEHLPAEVSRLLADAGMNVPASRIVLAGALAVDMIAAHRPQAALMVLGSDSLMRRAREAGLQVVPPKRIIRSCDVVLLARDRRFSFSRLAIAANAVREGAELFVTNPDLTHPGVGETVVPETGALLRAMLACTGDVSYRIVGKPEPAIFSAALSILGLAPAQALMVGDNAATDGAGARKAGLHFLDVTTTPLTVSAILAQPDTPAFPHDRIHGQASSR